AVRGDRLTRLRVHPGRGADRSGHLRAAEPGGGHPVRVRRSSDSVPMTVTHEAARALEADAASATSTPRNRRPTGLRRFLTTPAAAAGSAIVRAIVLLSLFGPAFSPYDPTAMSPAQRLLPPGAPGHPLGTDQVGRDVLTRLMDGGRRTLLIGAVPMALALALGTTLGLVAGFYGGWPDQAIMRSVDLLFAFPSILLAIAIVAALGPGLADTIIAITIVEIPAVARIARAPVLSLREHEFVQAARVLGA